MVGGTHCKYMSDIRIWDKYKKFVVICYQHECYHLYWYYTKISGRIRIETKIDLSSANVLNTSPAGTPFGKHDIIDL